MVTHRGAAEAVAAAASGRKKAWREFQRVGGAEWERDD